MSKRSYDELNSKHIKKFEKKKKFKKMLKSDEFKCYNKKWFNKCSHLHKEKTDEEITEMVNNASKIWSENYELQKNIKELKRTYYFLYNEYPRGRLANNIHWLKNKIIEKNK